MTRFGKRAAVVEAGTGDKKAAAAEPGRLDVRMRGHGVPTLQITRS